MLVNTHAESIIHTEKMFARLNWSMTVSVRGKHLSCQTFALLSGELTLNKFFVSAFEPRNKTAIGDQYSDFDKYKKTGAPTPLADRPVITKMSDRRLTLCWKPSVSISPRIPVTYQVEMLELPEGDWVTVRTGVRSCTCEVRNLIPFKDYRFRIRVENQYGVSDPSPYVQTYRHKLEPPAPHVYTYLDSNTDFRPDQSPYFPKDFDIERPPHDGYAQAPMYVTIHILP